MISTTIHITIFTLQNMCVQKSFLLLQMNPFLSHKKICQYNPVNLKLNENIYQHNPLTATIGQGLCCRNSVSYPGVF